MISRKIAAASRSHPDDKKHPSLAVFFFLLLLYLCWSAGSSFACVPRCKIAFHSAAFFELFDAELVQENADIPLPASERSKFK
jgi:hypothetical protein